MKWDFIVLGRLSHQVCIEQTIMLCKFNCLLPKIACPLHCDSIFFFLLFKSNVKDITHLLGAERNEFFMDSVQFIRGVGFYHHIQTFNWHLVLSFDVTVSFPFVNRFHLHWSTKIRLSLARHCAIELIAYSTITENKVNPNQTELRHQVSFRDDFMCTWFESHKYIAMT